jgi:hypothetical protein
MLREDLFDRFNPFVDRLRVVGCAVLSDEVFENIRRNIHPGFDILDEVLSNDSTGEDVEGLSVDVLCAH